MATHYRALTRTYRPQTFDDVVSQEHVSSTLKNAIRQNRISHAYMFCGPRGVGKTTMARVLARAINQIDENVDGEALSQTLNVVEIDAASNNKVEDVHHLREIVRVPPQSGKYKIFIIDEVHMLSKQAFNALLKTLEEPPAHAIFIFATTEPHKVLPTILSRVQRFDFKRISINEIINRLRVICDKEGIKIDEESLHTIARKADGALRDALGLMDQAVAFCGLDIHYEQLVQALNVIGNDELFEVTNSITERNSRNGLLLIDRLMKEGTDIQEFLVSMTTHLRNLYVAKQGTGQHLIEATEDTRQRYFETATAFSEEDLMRMMHLVSEAQIKLKEVQQPRVHFEILILKLIHMSRVKELTELVKGLSHLKKNSDNRQAEHLGGLQETDISPSQKAVSENAGLGKASRLNTGSIPVPAKNDDDFDELLTGKPSLGYAKGISSENGNHDSGDKNHMVLPQAVKTANKLEDIEAVWPEFLELISIKGSKTLFHQFENVKLKKLKGSELTISANNMFASNLVEENKNLLSSLLKETIGIQFRLNCVVERQNAVSADSLNPYEQFRELQKKDPHLKTIVELFGAELEY
jgi:DNA polymerase III subunit gamma/tau